MVMTASGQRCIHTQGTERAQAPSLRRRRQLICTLPDAACTFPRVLSPPDHPVCCRSRLWSPCCSADQLSNPKHWADVAGTLFRLVDMQIAATSRSACGVRRRSWEKPTTPAACSLCSRSARHNRHNPQHALCSPRCLQPVPAASARSSAASAVAAPRRCVRVRAVGPEDVQSAIASNPLFHNSQFMGVLQDSLARQGADALTRSAQPAEPRWVLGGDGWQAHPPPASHAACMSIGEGNPASHSVSPPTRQPPKSTPHQRINAAAGFARRRRF